MTNQNFRVKNGLQVGNITIDSGSGIITATKFVGDGSSLTNLPSGGGSGTSDFVRTSAGIHTLSNVGFGTTVVNSVLNISSPGIANTTNYIVTYGNFDVEIWGGIGTYSAVHYDFTTDGDNNTYVVGAFCEDYYTTGAYGESESRVSKPFIVKINSSKELEWNYILESSNSDYSRYSEACGISSASNGEVVVAVRSYYDANVGLGSTSLSFIRINSSGNIVWQTTIDNIDHEKDYTLRKPNDSNLGLRKFFIETDSSGNIYASGYAGYPSNKPYILKLNSSGAIQYTKFLYNTTGPTQFTIRGSDLYWTGRVTSSGQRIRVLKLDTDANIVTDRWFNYTGFNENEKNTLNNIDSSGNIYFFTRIRISQFSGGLGHGYLVEKYNSSYVRQWTKRINTTTSGNERFNGYPNSITFDSSGNIYLIAANSNLNSRHTYGYDVIKLNSSGDLMWKRFLSVPNIGKEYRSIENTIQSAVASKVEVKGNEIRFVVDVATPDKTKDIFDDGSNQYENFRREIDSYVSWIQKQSSDTLSFIVANLDANGDSIGVYGGYSVEELIPVRNGKYIIPQSPTEFISNLSAFHNTISNVGIGSTVGPAGFTTSSVNFTTPSTTNYFGSGFIQYENYPHFKSDKRELFSLNIEGTTKLSKLIVGNIEFGGNDEGLHTIAIGYSAGFYSKPEDNSHPDRFAKYNTFIGSYAGPSNTGDWGTYEYNNFIGYRAGSYSYGGTHNNYIGAFAGYYVGGNYNIFFGSCAGYANSWGECNTFIGCRAGAWTTGTSSSVMIGAGAGGFGGSYGGYGHVFIGGYAGGYAAANNYDSDYNIFIGQYAGRCATGDYNTFIGYYAGAKNTSGYSNNFLGECSGAYNLTGSYNSFFGRFSGYNNLTGCNNVFLGCGAGYYNTNGSDNVFIGRASGYASTEGYNNIFLGAQSGESNQGSYNLFFGKFSGKANTIGRDNIFLGSYSGISDAASRKIIIGLGTGSAYEFDSPDPYKDFQLAIGVRTDANPSKYWLVGDENFNVGIGTTNPTTKLHVGGDVKVGINTSQGIILTSPNGTAYRLVVDDSGNLTTTLV